MLTEMLCHADYNSSMILGMKSNVFGLTRTSVLMEDMDPFNAELLAQKTRYKAKHDMAFPCNLISSLVKLEVLRIMIDNDQTLTWQMVCLFFKKQEQFVFLQRCRHHELGAQLANEVHHLQHRHLQV